MTGDLSYRKLLGLPGVAAQAVLGFLAQLTQQVAPIGIVLVTQQATGSLAFAGATAAAFGVGAGMGRPVQGRLMDRRGAGPVLAGTAVLHVAALLALLACARVGRPWWPLPLLAWSAGIGLPPISVSMRIAWGARMAAEGRTAAYSLVYLVQETAMMVGPLVFGLLIAVASSSLALGVVAGAAGAGTLAFARALRTGHVAAVRQRGRVFTDRRMLMLLAVTTLLGAVVGGRCRWACPRWPPPATYRPRPGCSWPPCRWAASRAPPRTGPASGARASRCGSPRCCSCSGSFSRRWRWRGRWRCSGRRCSRAGWR
ncbi:hypothetical protein GCM10020001_037120 [Nonomuraea salmonea]